MLPQPFLERMEALLGEEYQEFLDSLSQERYQALRVNALKWKKEKEALPFELTPVPWAEAGFYYEKGDAPGRHPLHSAGVYYIQEPSAMAPAGLLGVQPGERVLDLCAAPGGKSTQLAAFLRGEGLLVCNEIHPARARILSENIERMGVRNACVTNETPQALAEAFEGYFDRVLVDAPCSGEGMFRKNEEACSEWSLENVELCAARQDEILDCAARLLRPGGRLVYSTCTFAPAENEGSISRFLKRHPEYSLLPIEKKAYGEGCSGRPEWIKEPAPGLENTLRLWPHRIKGEGHYAALLAKAALPMDEISGESSLLQEEQRRSPFGDTGTGRLRPGKRKPGGTKGGLRSDTPEEWEAFSREYLKTELTGRLLRFGENLYLVPEELPALDGLKVMRPGLQLGTLKKNRFEPSHALALALGPEDAVHVWKLSSDAPEARDYLAGQTFPAEGEKGWYLICVDGCSIGWGKLAGGSMKNHYPKGLRKL